MFELLLLLLGLAIVIVPIWTAFRTQRLERDTVAMHERIEELERQVSRLLGKLNGPADVIAESQRTIEKVQLDQPAVRPVVPPPTPTPPEPGPVSPRAIPVGPTEVPVAMPPLPVVAAVSRAEPAPPAVEEAERSSLPRVNWEQFMGAKLFAWLGGFAAFLGAAFFVKYSFEHDLIPPEVRVAFGFVFALALLVGGVLIRQRRYAVTGQTLCGTGIVCLYAVTFACNSIYHFEFFGPGTTFAVMTLITAVAFLLAVRLAAPVVAILGLLGGFLTPILLSTGQDNAAGLFSYLALLNLGLLAVALSQRWHYLVSLAAIGTLLMQIGWAIRFLEPEKVATAMAVALGHCVLFLLAALAGRHWKQRSGHLSWPALAFPFLGLGFALVFIGYASVAERPGRLFGYVLLVDVTVLAAGWCLPRLAKAVTPAGLIVFLLLAVWTSSALTEDLLPWALALYLLFAAVHTALPLIWQRLRPESSVGSWGHLFPPLALLFTLWPVLSLEPVPLLVWPFVLLIDLLAVGIALFTASVVAVVAVVAVVLLTTLVTAVWLFQVPTSIDSAPLVLLVIGGFAVLFFAAALWLSSRLAARWQEHAQPGWLTEATKHLPALSALLPFLLLIMVAQRLPLVDPSMIFGLALLLVALLLGLARLMRLAWLPLFALIGLVALQWTWHHSHFAAGHAGLVIGWYSGFLMVFVLFPFVFASTWRQHTGPWAVAALAAVAHFPLIHRAVRAGWPGLEPGFLPVGFAGLLMVGLLVLRRLPAVAPAVRLNQLAWLGGAVLFFVTLVFPLQFERQWLTLGWALEGAALIWLYHRVPHSALRATGVVLLVVAFARLALNPSILAYHTTSGTAPWNWYLYSYGIVTLCLLLGARWLSVSGRTEEPKTLGFRASRLLYPLGVILAFLLLNLQIADYFSPAGRAVLVFEFSGNLARDMTYTIAWAVFALALLLIGILRRVRAARWAALALLGLALLKLFFHDLASLEALYRVGALFAVSVVAILASVAYQRFLPTADEAAPETTGTSR
jgi:uncharacterized membrane protein